MSTRAALLVAAAPAVSASALMMHAAGVDRADIGQQLLIALVSATAAWLTPARRSRVGLDHSRWWSALLLALCLFLPLTDDQDWGPRRWLYFGGFGLYVAPVVIPSLLLCLSGTPAAALLAGGLALLLQPDAAQLTALTAASIPVLLASRHGRGAQGLIASVLTIALGVCWTLPDPLAPVDHVEGVLRMAAAMGPLTVASASVAVLLPSATLSWLAFRQRSVGLLAAGVYLATLVCLSPLEVTPVPFLGFGSGPILGYAFMVWTAAPLSPRR